MERGVAKSPAYSYVGKSDRALTTWVADRRRPHRALTPHALILGTGVETRTLVTGFGDLIVFPTRTCIVLEVLAGFEPAMIGFADRRLNQLVHRTKLCPAYPCPNRLRPGSLHAYAQVPITYGLLSF